MNGNKTIWKNGTRKRDNGTSQRGRQGGKKKPGGTKENEKNLIQRKGKLAMKGQLWGKGRESPGVYHEVTKVGMASERSSNAVGNCPSKNLETRNRQGGLSIFTILPKKSKIRRGGETNNLFCYENFQDVKKRGKKFDLMRALRRRRERG